MVEMGICEESDLFLVDYAILELWNQLLSNEKDKSGWMEERGFVYNEDFVIADIRTHLLERKIVRISLFSLN